MLKGITEGFDDVNLHRLTPVHIPLEVATHLAEFGVFVEQIDQFHVELGQDIGGDLPLKLRSIFGSHHQLRKHLDHVASDFGIEVLFLLK